MLSLLRIRQLVLIDELELDLDPGFTVITGETGAGKSILVRALRLVLGARARADLVRTGAEAAVVEALFDVRDDPAARARLRAEGLDEDDEIVLRRVVHASGRSRAYVNGRVATAAQLRRLATGLVDVTSQHAAHSLAEPAAHLQVLDAYGGLEALGERVRAAVEAVEAAGERRDALARAARERVDREGLLRFQLAELDRVDPQPGEDAALEEERVRLSHATRLAAGAQRLEAALYEDDGALAPRLGRLVGELEDLAHLDPSLAPLAEQLASAHAEVEDAALSLGTYGRSVEADPYRLEQVEDRLRTLRGLLRRHGPTLDDVLARHEELTAELDALGELDDTLAEAEVAWAAALTTAAAAARELSAARREHAARLEAALTDELSQLAMGDARVLVQVAPREGGAAVQVDGASLSRAGIDRVELLVATNRGEPPRPLRDAASGGELSRALLAIKRVLAGLGPAGAYVFDEVDAGVGGAVADVIGRKLAEVGRHHQVLCITHLPQIAARGDHHLHVRKQVAGERTVTRLSRLTTDQREHEVGRMLGGAELTEGALAAARALLE